MKFDKSGVSSKKEKTNLPNSSLFSLDKLDNN